MKHLIFKPYERKPALLCINGFEFPVTVFEKTDCNKHYKCVGKTGTVYQVKYEQLKKPEGVE